MHKDLSLSHVNLDMLEKVEYEWKAMEEMGEEKGRRGKKEQVGIHSFLTASRTL